MPLYNAIVYKHDGNVIKYRMISRPDAFVKSITDRNAVKSIFFYTRKSKKDKSGVYAGYWKYLTGLRMK